MTVKALRKHNGRVESYEIVSNNLLEHGLMNMTIFRKLGSPGSRYFLARSSGGEYGLIFERTDGRWVESSLPLEKVFSGINWEGGLICGDTYPLLVNYVVMEAL